MLRGAMVHWIICAVILTGWNVIKPMHVDDVIWVHFAQHIAIAPTDPFGFTLPWGYGCIPAIEMWSPPMLPYWWGAGVAIFGDAPALWKAWFLPFLLIYSGASFSLAQRFAPAFALPVGYAMALAPTVLPAVNLMQDVPAAALLLAAVALTLKGCARASLPLGLLGGACLGLACLTKWSALSGFGTVGLACLLFAPHWRWWILVPGTALAIFAGWEGYLLAAYGQSNFLLAILEREETTTLKDLAIALVTFSGALIPFVAIAGWGARVSGRWLALTMSGLFALALLALAVLPETLAIANPLTGRGLRPDTPLLAGLGLLVWSGLVLSLGSRVLQAPLNRGLVFLILWFGIELVGYFVLSPFPAARRLVVPAAVMVLVVAATIRPGTGTAALRLATGVQVAIGLLFATIDLADSQRIKAAATWVAETAPQGTKLWSKGVFGFDYYIARFGAEPPCATDVLQPGETLAIYDLGLEGGRFRNPSITALEQADALRRLATFSEAAPLPWTTMGGGYYLGRRPIEGGHGPLHGATVFEVMRPIAWTEVAPQ